MLAFIRHRLFHWKSICGRVGAFCEARAVSMLIALVAISGCRKTEQSSPIGGLASDDAGSTQAGAPASPSASIGAGSPVEWPPGGPPAWYADLAKEAASADFRKGEIKTAHLAWALIPTASRARFTLVQVESLGPVDARVRLLERDEKTGDFNPSNLVVSHVPASVLLEARTVKDQLVNEGSSVRPCIDPKDATLCPAVAILTKVSLNTATVKFATPNGVREEEVKYLEDQPGDLRPFALAKCGTTMVGTGAEDDSLLTVVVVGDESVFGIDLRGRFARALSKTSCSVVNLFPQAMKWKVGDKALVFGLLGASNENVEQVVVPGWIYRTTHEASVPWYRLLTPDKSGSPFTREISGPGGTQ